MNFIEQVYRGKNDWWRYLITILIVMSPFLLNFVIWFVMPEIFDTIYEDMENFDGNKNIFLLQNLIPFVFLLVFLLLFVKFLHQRSIRSLVTSRKKIDWKRVLFSFLLWFFVSVSLLAVGLLTDSDSLVWNFKPVPFLILVLISFLFIPLQTSLEELLFRGYLMQGLGGIVRNRWVPLFVTSILFGLMHSLNPEVEKLGYEIMVFYIGTGLFFGMTTLLDEGTEIALGLHAANNIVAAIFVTANWAVFNTDALFVDTAEPTLDWTIYIPVFVVYPIILLILSKKYGWKNWSHKLFGKVEETVVIEDD